MGYGQVSGHVEVACHHRGLAPGWAQRKWGRGEEVLSYIVSVSGWRGIREWAAVSPVC